MQFLNTEISQGSVATPLRCDGIFKYDYSKFTSEFISVTILKIG